MVIRASSRHPGPGPSGPRGRAAAEAAGRAGDGAPICRWRAGRAGSLSDRVVGAPAVTIEPRWAAQANSDSECRCVRVQGSARFAGSVSGHAVTESRASPRMRGTGTRQRPTVPLASDSSLVASAARPPASLSQLQ